MSDYYFDEASTAKPACIGHDPEIWFDEAARFAKRICNGIASRGIPACPVKDACLAKAMELREDYGVFGGLDPRERKLLRKKAVA